MLLHSFVINLFHKLFLIKTKNHLHLVHLMNFLMNLNFDENNCKNALIGYVSLICQYLLKMFVYRNNHR